MISRRAFFSRLLQGAALAVVARVAPFELPEPLARPRINHIEKLNTALKEIWGPAFRYTVVPRHSILADLLARAAPTGTATATLTRTRDGSLVCWGNRA